MKVDDDMNPPPVNDDIIQVSMSFHKKKLEKLKGNPVLWILNRLGECKSSEIFIYEDKYTVVAAYEAFHLPSKSQAKGFEQSVCNRQLNQFKNSKQFENLKKALFEQ